MPAPTEQPKAAPAEKARASARGWLTTKELAAAIGWRAHTLRDALRGREVAGIMRTSFGYYVDEAAVPEIRKLLGAAPTRARKPKKT